MIIIIQVAILTVYAGISYFLIPNQLDWWWLVIGLVLGRGVLLIDKFYLFRYYLDQTEQQLQPRTLISRSLVFLIIFIPLAIYVVSSSGSPIGWGMVISLAVVFATELLATKNKPEIFKQKFLWQTKQNFSQTEREMLSWGYAVLVVVLIGLTGS